jgi:hypothetical protein
MRLVIIYRPNSEYSRITEEFVKDYQDRYQFQSVEIVDVDTREGIALVTLYDIMQYPAVLALQNDGSTQKIWQGPQLPPIGEVASYTSN